jgi:hypothetical protein
MPGVSGKQGMEQDWTDLPASVVGQPGNLHSMGRSTRARRGAFVTTTEAFFVAVSAGELDGEALSHEDSSMESWDDIAGIQRILVLDKTEAVHKLDLGDLTSAMLGEVVLDIGLGGCSGEQLCQR